jgi:hypothetical protein
VKGKFHAHMLAAYQIMMSKKSYMLLAEVIIDSMQTTQHENNN